MYNRFNDIIVGLQNRGKKLEPNELNRKLLTTLYMNWKPKVMAMEKTKNLKITMEELLEFTQHA